MLYRLARDYIESTHVYTNDAMWRVITWYSGSNKLHSFIPVCGIQQDWTMQRGSSFRVPTGSHCQWRFWTLPDRDENFHIEVTLSTVFYVIQSQIFYSYHIRSQVSGQAVAGVACSAKETNTINWFISVILWVGQWLIQQELSPERHPEYPGPGWTFVCVISRQKTCMYTYPYTLHGVLNAIVINFQKN